MDTVLMGKKNKRSKASVKAKSKRRRKAKRLRYLNTKKIKNEENVMHVHVCPFSNASMTDSDTNSVFSNTSSNTSGDYQADNSNTRNEKKQMPKVLTETDDVYKEMNNDKLFSMIVKYHTKEGTTE